MLGQNDQDMQAEKMLPLPSDNGWVVREALVPVATPAWVTD